MTSVTLTIDLDLQHKRFDLIILDPDSFVSNANRSAVIVDRLTIILLSKHNCLSVLRQWICGEQRLQTADFRCTFSIREARFPHAIPGTLLNWEGSVVHCAMMICNLDPS